MATHDTLEIGEQLFWVRLRSGTSVFRRVLKDSFADDLSALMPGRVLPVSTEPIADMTSMVEHEIRAVLALLAPKTRKGPEARARIRPLLSLDGAAKGEWTRRRSRRWRRLKSCSAPVMTDGRCFQAVRRSVSLLSRLSWAPRR